MTMVSASKELRNRFMEKADIIEGEGKVKALAPSGDESKRIYERESSNQTAVDPG